MLEEGKKEPISNLPIKLIFFYIAFSLVAFLISTKEAAIDSIFATLYVLICMIFLWFGYCVHIRINSVQSYSAPVSLLKSSKIRGLIVFCSIAVMLTSIINVMSYYPTYKAAVDMLSVPAKAYEYVKLLRRTGTDIQRTSSLIGVILTALTFTKYILFGTAIQLWKKFHLLEKILVLSAAVIYFIHALLIGAMINIGSVAMSMVPSAIMQFKDVSYDKRKLRKLKRLLIVLFLIIMLVLANLLGSRGAYGTKNGTSFESLRNGIIGLLDYVSQGYTGLSQCLRLPFVPTFGYTSLYGLSTKIGPLLGIPDLFQSSYLARNELAGGQPALQKWSTIFPWLASDVSFVFVPLIMFAVGYLFKKSWITSNVSDSFLAPVLCGQFCILLFMIPANNQVLHTFANATSFIFIYLLFKSERKLFG